MQALLIWVLFGVFLAAVVGVIKPYILGARRRHFALGAIAAFALVIVVGNMGGAGADRYSTSAGSTSAVESTSRTMSFDDCIDAIQDVATDLGTAPINIVETSTMRMVRFNTADGSVLVTCSAEDNKMVLTRSPHRG